jgi:hypothetical protein
MAFKSKKKTGGEGCDLNEKPITPKEVIEAAIVTAGAPLLMGASPVGLPVGVFIHEAEMFFDLLKNLAAQCNSGHITPNDKIWGMIQQLHDRYVK